ncbi:FixH family protein [Azospirillum sp. A39]
MSTDVRTELSANRRGGPTRARGWYIPWLFVAFFLLVFTANGFMVYIATSTYNGLETENHFVKGILYNKSLEGARAQAERGWQVDLAFAPTEALKGIVAVTLHDKHGNLLRDSTVTVRFIRPTAEGHDFETELPYLGEGRYAKPVELPLPGQWDMRLTIVHGGDDFQDQQRIFVK